MAFAVFADQGFGFGIAEVFNALLGAEVEFHPKALVFGIDKAISVRAEAVHVAVAFRNAAVAHHDGDLVEGFGQQRPKIPVVARAAHIGARVAFHHAIEVFKFERVAQEKHGRVVARHIPVAFFSVKLQRKAADVALGIGTTALNRHGGKAGEHVGFFAHFAKDGGAGVLSDVFCYRESAESA